MQDIDVFTFINKIGGASFATLLVVILWGSWRDIWCWGKDKRAAETSLLERIKRTEEDRDWWRGIALKATGIAEVQGRVLRVTVGGVDDSANVVDGANKRLLPGGG
jgi:hypothetical protein